MCFQATQQTKRQVMAETATYTASRQQDVAHASNKRPKLASEAQVGHV